MSEINISGLDRADLLAALFNASKPLGLGFLDSGSQNPMTKADAQIEISESTGLYFDYVRGRVIKCDLSGDTLRAGSYNRNNGPGAAEAVVDSVRQGITMASRVSQPTNRVEELAAAGRAEEAVRAADALIVFSLAAEGSSAAEDTSAAPAPAPAPAQSLMSGRTVMVALRHESTMVPRAIVLTVALNLEGLWDEGMGGMLACSDLVELCKNPGHIDKMRSVERETLESLSLLGMDGSIDEAIKAIVLSSFDGDGLDMTYVGPQRATVQPVLNFGSGSQAGAASESQAGPST